MAAAGAYEEERGTNCHIGGKTDKSEGHPWRGQDHQHALLENSLEFIPWQR